MKEPHSSNHHGSPGFLGNPGWHTLDLDEIPSYSRRHRSRLSSVLLASIGLLVIWIYVHQVVVPDVGKRSILLLGLCVVPHSLLGWLILGRLKPSWREYGTMYVIAVAYTSIQFLFAISRSVSAPYLLAGTCYLFLILSNLMLRFRFGNALVFSLYATLLSMWLFAWQGNDPALVICFHACACLAALYTLYVNAMIGDDEMHYMRLEQHFRLVLQGDRRDLWEFDRAAQVVNVRKWNGAPSQAPIVYPYQDYLSLIHSEERAAVVRVIEDCITGRVFRFQLEFRICTERQSDWRWVQLAGYASERGNDGLPTRLRGTCCDVTDRKSLHARVEQQSREFEQAAREKAHFLATISHSIRTPLNAVIGATAVLAADDLPAESREMVETIQCSGQLLLTVLNDVLELSPSTLASPQLHPAVFSPRHMLGYCCGLIHPLAQRKNLELRLRVAPEVFPHVRGDQVRLQQVLTNLLSNAVKFTERGSVELLVSAEPSSDPAVQMITFAVSDTGVGIDKNAQRSLFGRFEQLHLQTTAGRMGSGLGLAISQRLVEAMGGLIRCDSKAGSGSTFSFTLRLPAARVATAGKAEDEPLAQAAASPVQSCRARVLVAEDNPVNQRVLTRMLEKLHCEVELAGNGAEAVEACERQIFDIILMDCDMPVLNGLDATRRIRHLKRFAGVPIIAATAHTLPANLDACLEAGMSDTLTKPLTLARLAAAVEQWVAGPLSPIERGAGR